MKQKPSDTAAASAAVQDTTPPAPPHPLPAEGGVYEFHPEARELRKLEGGAVDETGAQP